MDAMGEKNPGAMAGQCPFGEPAKEASWLKHDQLTLVAVPDSRFHARMFSRCSASRPGSPRRYCIHRLNSAHSGGGQQRQHPAMRGRWKVAQAFGVVLNEQAVRLVEFGICHRIQRVGRQRVEPLRAAAHAGAPRNQPVGRPSARQLARCSQPS